jgi:hypothetical protein
LTRDRAELEAAIRARDPERIKKARQELREDRGELREDLRDRRR